MWIIYALSASLVWGLDYVLAEKFFKARVSPLSFLAMQSLTAAIILVPLAMWRGILGELRNAMNMQMGWWQIPAALIGFTAGNYLVACAIQAKNATLASLIEISYPLAIVLFSLVLLGTTHLSIGAIVGGTLIAIGVIVIYLFN
ncbi:MAG: DMT family transporter [Planctomycetes bacterium]|uniref:DMT family transporter n=1 Tax=Candidatus Wunengus sp. YC65 TaxID=3367701 RepID=UPI001DB2C49F|nr:DMT family transporter [Planctomycetota bacterium]MBI5795338.1 DMT family transporter [Planctomycetota bacterium]